MGQLVWTRRYSFQSVHSLNSGVLRERRHGHHYYLEVSFSESHIDSVDQVVEEKILAALHARELRDLTPSTGETIVDWIHAQLLKSSVATRIKAVALQETRKNRFVSGLSEERYV